MGEDGLRLLWKSSWTCKRKFDYTQIRVYETDRRESISHQGSRRVPQWQDVDACWELGLCTTSRPPLYWIVKPDTTGSPLHWSKIRKDVGTEAKFRQDMRREIPVKDEVTPTPLLIGYSLQPSKTTLDDKNGKIVDKHSSRHRFASFCFSTYGSSRVSNDCKFDKEEEATKKVIVPKSANTQFTTALDLNDCRRQNQSQKYSSPRSGKIASRWNKRKASIKKTVF